MVRNRGFRAVRKWGVEVGTRVCEVYPTTEVLYNLRLKVAIMKLSQILKNADSCHSHEVVFANAVELRNPKRE